MGRALSALENSCPVYLCTVWDAASDFAAMYFESFKIRGERIKNVEMYWAEAGELFFSRFELVVGFEADAFFRAFRDAAVGHFFEIAENDGNRFVVGFNFCR